jgi:hypothetical protein
LQCRQLARRRSLVVLQRQQTKEEETRRGERRGAHKLAEKMMSSGRACLLRLLIVAMLLPVASGFCAGSLPLQKRIGGGSCQQRLRPAAGLRNARASIGKIKKDGRADPEELQLQRRLGTVTVTVAMPLEEDFNLFERICMVSRTSSSPT